MEPRDHGLEHQAHARPASGVEGESATGFAFQRRLRRSPASKRNGEGGDCSRRPLRRSEKILRLRQTTSRSVKSDGLLGPGARVLGAWICGRPPGWVFRPAHIRATLGYGKDAYRTARRELIACGYLSMDSERTTDGRYGPPVWNVHPEGDVLPTGESQSAERTGGAGEPVKNTGAGFTGGGKPASGEASIRRAGAGAPGRLTKPAVPRTEKLKTPQPPPPPPPPPQAQALGARLADLLNEPSAVERVNRASSGASDSQLTLAAEVVRRQVGGGAVRSVVAFAMKMAKLAGEGQIQAPAPRPSSGETEALWERRAAAAGRYLVHPKHGRHTVLPGARAWQREDGQTVSGANGLKLWEKVEAGEYVLHRD